mmetsp:Transcript_39243/g.118021  ORF Transcript_39243/g.118021 Transcript_39243/m.118021 type:complete len:504 (+) Transcript_39243:466-1977(+)
MVAEDFKDSKKAAVSIYGCIRDLLMSRTISSDRKLPLVYLVDSILKNVKGQFIPLVELDAKEWLAVAHDVVSDEQKKKIRRVWNTWREFRIFGEGSLKAMGRCFSEFDAQAAATRKVAEAKAKAIGIEKMPDGTLKLSPELRKQMQVLLDEAQSEGVDELEKVSLERLSEINPNLLIEIKKAAKEMVSNGDAGGAKTSNIRTSCDSGPSQSFWIESRPPDVIARSDEWEKLDLNHLEKTHDIISKLQHRIRIGTTKSEPVENSAGTTSLLAVSSATATHLTAMLKHFQGPNDISAGIGKSNVPYYMGDQTALKTTSATIDKTMFTNEGIKEKNDTVIARLFGAGLPFKSASDGRRFATQIALSHHLDELFRKSQIEKTMETTEERGWYISELRWTGKDESPGASADADATGTAGEAEAEEEVSPEKSTVPADETRDRCIICGINFNMFFDQDEGDWKYKNCREIKVMNDEAAEKESELMLVHVTCLRGLGSPDFLTADQVLQQ